MEAGNIRDQGRTVEVAPAVLGPEMIEADDLPDTLHTPTAAPMRDDGVTFVLRTLDNGSRALLVFSSLENLVRGCGDDQPWTAFRSQAVHEFQHLAEADTVLWDPVLAPEIRQYGEYDGEER
ncbi:SAV_915 family protein [Amycolatopsis suaedae]|uniref:SseB family protein n=1 Tax=Amycolatopsis suaedae TaxID=2510978 RepID=A0A4Q7JD00_9PSEU|nr:SAV_915 family protein [Amycolatopsis suaedae]RZQ65217.1 hypothetical protein EWH70_04830 [Amycolatopsis suaedae]